MTNTYAINTTRNEEFTVERELTDLGLHPWVPRQLASRYIKERRETSWYDRAYVPKLLFCVIPAIYWSDVVGLKHVIGKPYHLSELDIRGIPAHTVKGTERHVPERFGLVRFKQEVTAEYEDMQRRRVNSSYICQYRPGQALTMLAGVFEGMDATFVDSIRRAHDEYDRLRVSIEIMGRPSIVEVDPDKVEQYGV